MSVSSDRPDPTPTTSTPNRVERRSFNRLCVDRMKHFASTLKTNAQRMKQFLHAGG